MIQWIMYDIHNNKTRNKIAKYCQRIGMYRIQHSVFAGKISQHKLDEFTEFALTILDPERDQIVSFQSSEKQFENLICIGFPVNKKLFLQKTPFFII